MDPYGFGGGAESSFAERLYADDVVLFLHGERQLRRGIGRRERAHLFVSLSPV